MDASACNRFAPANSILLEEAHMRDLIHGWTRVGGYCGSDLGSDRSWQASTNTSTS